MNRYYSKTVIWMAVILSIAAIYASLRGILDENLYRDVYEAGIIPERLIYGSIAQDYISTVAALVLMIACISFLKNPGIKIFIIILGLTSYLFYAFGLYVIPGQYTAIYLIYLFIFGLSIYTLITGMISFEYEYIRFFFLPSPIRHFTGIFMTLIVFFLLPIWINLMVPDLRQHTPGDTYAVYILDLCIVFPALIIFSVLIVRDKPYGRIFSGIGLFKAFTVCLSVAVGEWMVAALSGVVLNRFMFSVFTVMTVISLLLFVFYLFYLVRRKDEPMPEGDNEN